jgi:hypothetical protein
MVLGEPANREDPAKDGSLLLADICILYRYTM